MSDVSRSAQAEIAVGMAHVRSGELGEAAEAFRRAIAIDPDLTAAYNNLGGVLLELGREDEAAAAFDRALALKPDHAEAHHNLGVAHRQAGRLDQSIASLRRALDIRPAYPDAWNNLGIAYAEFRQFSEAADCYRRAVELNPRFAQAYNNLANALVELGDREAALPLYLRALTENPDYAAAYNNLGLLLRLLGRHQEARESFRRAIVLQPGFAEAHANLGVVLADLRLRDEAITSFGRALAINPDHSLARAQRLHLMARDCDWEGLAPELPLIPELGLTGGIVPPFALLSFDDDPPRNLIRSQRFAAARFPAPEPLPARPATRPEKIRLGYFSADFSEHAVMHLAARLFELHDRDRFSVHAYSYGPPSEDAMRDRLAKAFDSFADVAALGDGAIARTARDDAVDIAIDLQGYTERSRLGIFAHRAAPLQVSFLGYPGTTGAPFIDYLVADPIVIPAEERAGYSEALIVLPDAYQPNDDKRVISDRKWTRAEAGLPERGFVFCCFNNAYKITPAEFGIWMELLRAVEGSVLWLLATTPRAQANLRAAASSRGVDAGRIVFADMQPLAEHLARHRLADLFLDTFNYNAHTTASDALWAGLPLVTRAGRGFPARVAASLLTAAGLTELVTANDKQYAGLACALAHDPERLQALRDKLVANRARCPLFDSLAFTRHLETGFEQAFQRHLDGKPPEDLAITP